MEFIDRYITVWEFRSVDGKQVVQSVRPYELDELDDLDDARYQHEYQRIIYRGPLSGYRAKTA